MAHYQTTPVDKTLPHEEEALRLRREGMLLREIAATLGIEIHRVNYIMRKHSIPTRHQGGKHAKREIAPPSMTIDDALNLHDAIFIERGLNGGYLVTVNNKTGREEMSLRRAIGAAMQDGAQTRPSKQ